MAMGKRKVLPFKEVRSENGEFNFSLKKKIIAKKRLYRIVNFFSIVHYLSVVP